MREIYSDPAFVPASASATGLASEEWEEDDFVVDVTETPTPVITETPTDERLKLECYSLTRDDSPSRLEEAKAIYAWATEPTGFRPRTNR